VNTKRIRSVILSALLLSITVSAIVQPAASALSCPYDTVTKRPAGLTSISSTPSKFAQTDGDILGGAVGSTGTTNLLAIGGNFDNVIVDAVAYPAKNFAILNEDTGAVIYGAKNVNSYVRAIVFDNGKFYLGGDFTKFENVSRNYMAVVTTGGKLTSWNTDMKGTVRAIAVGTDDVYAGGWSNAVAGYNISTGKQDWKDKVSGGAVEALTLSPSLYVGGLFEKIADNKRHGLIRVDADTGTPSTNFKPVFKGDSGVGPHGDWDGEQPLSFAWDMSFDAPRLIVSYANNGIVSLNPSTGAEHWNRRLEGDGQAVGVVGGVYVVGYHRNHPNTHVGCAYPYYSASFGASTGKFLKYWNPRLTGRQGNDDGGNNGVQEIVVNTTTKRVIMLGAFTKHKATCVKGKIKCTGGTDLKSIAVFNYN
jgi:PQQ-like domain